MEVYFMRVGHFIIGSCGSTLALLFGGVKMGADSTAEEHIFPFSKIRVFFFFFNQQLFGPPLDLTEKLLTQIRFLKPYP